MYTVRDLKKRLIGHTIKITILVLNVLLKNILVFKIIGLLNKKFNFLVTVFVAYPTSRKYTRAYYYEWFAALIKWRPSLAGIFRQNGKWGLMLAITSMEKDFYNEENIDNLQKMVVRTEKIRQLIRAKQKTFAGVLPGLMFHKRIVRECPEADVTASVVVKAEKLLRESTNYPESVPLIILGGKGFIGRRVINNIPGEREVYCVDVNGDENYANLESWPFILKGQQAILINITKNAALSHYVDLFWPQLILLNEVYPDQKELKALTQISNPVYHVAGVKAKSYPPFPLIYASGIPCCAAYNTSKIQANIIKLN